MPSVKVLIISTLILIRHEEISGYSEIFWKVYKIYVDSSNYDLYSYFCSKLKESYKVDISNMSLEDINSKLEELALTYCERELRLAIAYGYLSELQEHKFNNKWSKGQIAVIVQLSELFGKDFQKIVKPTMSRRGLIYMAVIYDCDKELATQLSEYVISDELLYQICCGAQLGINLLDFALSGHTPEDLAQVLKASQLLGFNLDEMRKGDSNYLDMDRIVNFIVNY